MIAPRQLIEQCFPTLLQTGRVKREGELFRDPAPCRLR